MKPDDNPNAIHGRLLEAVHISGYSFERACGELEWLLEKDRWKGVGSGFENPKDFLATIDLSDFRIDAPHRKRLAKKLSALEASQRSIANALGAAQSTINEDLNSDRDRSAKQKKHNETNGENSSNDQDRSAKGNDGREAAKAIQEQQKKAARRALKEQEREARRAENKAKVGSATTLEAVISTGARFATLVFDPPWDWGDEGDIDQMGRARPQYETWSIEKLAGLPVEGLVDTDAHLYLWITNRSLPKGFGLLESWGFRYVTALTWVKPSFGMGNYFRGQTEQVLFGVRGSQPLKRKDISTVFHAPRGPDGHSSKPEEFYDIVENCSPGPYLEGFSRREREGWMTWGENS